MEAGSPSSYPPFAENRPHRFLSLEAILVLAILVVGIEIYSRYESVFGDRNANARYPTYSLTRLVDRNLELYGALPAASKWDRGLYRIFLGSLEDWEKYAIASYRDLLMYLEATQLNIDPREIVLTRARFVVLLAETGHTSEAQSEIQLLENSKEGKPLADLLRFGYGADTKQTVPSDIESARDLFVPGWTGGRAWIRIAAKTGDLRLVRDLETQLLERGKRWGRYVMLFILVDLAAVTGGLAIFLLCWARQRKLTQLVMGPDPTPWSWKSGLGVFVWSAFALQCLDLTWMFVGAYEIEIPYQLLTLVHLFLTVWLIKRYLLRPNKITFRYAFGLFVPPKSALRFLEFSLLVLAVQLASFAFIQTVAWELGFPPHWTEGLNEDLIWGSWSAVLLSALDYVVWGPLFEEIVFRGLLYGSLQTYLGRLSATIISATLFSAWHFYSLPGFITILIVGVVWAIAYERCRSLYPLILSHSAVNFILVVGVLLFYR